MADIHTLTAQTLPLGRTRREGTTTSLPSPQTQTRPLPTTPQTPAHNGTYGGSVGQLDSLNTPSMYLCCMAESERFDALVGSFVATARAHHEATGGVNPQWADWYANKLVDDVNEVVDAEMSSAGLSEWLVEADSRYRSEDQGVSWPKAYASWLLAESP